MANAWCINAIWFDWTYLRTLQCLDSSNIGVGVQYTAPNPLDDKRFDYIKYTDKCWCTCCLTWENEILIYATQWVIKNFTLTNNEDDETVDITWNDVFWSNWLKTVVRYKTGSYPTWIEDWTLAVEETTKNAYSSDAFQVSGLEDWTTYYFTAFAVDLDGTIIVMQNMNITTEFGWHPSDNTILYLPFEEDMTDKSWKWTSVSVWKTSVSLTTLNWIKCAYFNWWILDTQITDNTFDRTVLTWIYIISWEVMALQSNPCWVFAWHYLMWSDNILSYGWYYTSNLTRDWNTNKTLTDKQFHCSFQV